MPNRIGVKNVRMYLIQLKRLAISIDALLFYPNFNNFFVIHMDSRKSQSGAIISQDDKPIAFYSRKLNSAQVNYTTT